MSPQEGHGAGQGFPALVGGVDVADVIDVCPLLAGLAARGAVPAAR